MFLGHTSGARLLWALVFVILRDGKARGEALRDAPMPVIHGELAQVMVRRLNDMSICVSGECQ